MLKAGIPIAAGTDAGNIGTLHGSSFFQELQAMKQAGMNNWQLIRSVTIEGAKAMGMEKDFGAIKVGMKANMLLLRDNPLLEIGNLQQIDLIINKGVVLDPEGLIKE
jgi:imidazolonepropionase-like amidohydrolase